MRINILGEAEAPNYRDKYVVECEAMFGDADGKGMVVIGGFVMGKDEEYLADLLQTCERLTKAYPHGRGGGDDYDHIEGFNRWFRPDNLSLEEWESLPKAVQDLSSEWLMEPDGMGHQASFEGYEVFYYDENGVKFNVAVEL